MDSLEQQRKYAKGLAVRTRIIDAAARAFGRGGYGATSVMDLAAEAQVTKNQLFHHFQGKEAIALASVDAAAIWWRDEVATASQIYPDAGAQLEFMLKCLNDSPERSAVYLRLVAALSTQLNSLPPDLNGHVSTLLGDITGFLRTRIKLLKRQGTTAQSYKAREMAACLTAALLGGEILAAAGIETSGAGALEMILDMLRGGTSSAQDDDESGDD